jgi:phosphatidylethanolamine-binding protein
VQLLFQQPAAFAVPASRASAVSSRIGFDLQSFVSAAGLGMPVMADFFVVVGAQSQVASRGASASASATASGGVTKNSLLPFEGAAAGRSGLLGGGWAAMVAGVLGLAVL